MPKEHGKAPARRRARQERQPEESAKARRPLAEGAKEPGRAVLPEEQDELLALPTEARPPLLSRVIVWCTVLLCLLLLLATFGQAWNVYQLNQQVAAQQQAVNQLTAQNHQLQSSIRMLQDPATIEQEARRLGYIYPGDQPVVVIVSGKPSPAPPAKPVPPDSSPWGFWSDWLKFFFGG